MAVQTLCKQPIPIGGKVLFFVSRNALFHGNARTPCTTSVGSFSEILHIYLCFMLSLYFYYCHCIDVLLLSLIHFSFQVITEFSG